MDSTLTIQHRYVMIIIGLFGLFSLLLIQDMERKTGLEERI